MNPIYAHYINEEEDMQRRAELNLERKVLRGNFEPFDLPDREFRKLFRMNKELYQELIDELTPHMLVGQRSTKLSINNRVMGALRFFATGSYQKGIGDERSVAVSQQTMSNTIAEVATALETIAPRWIKFPMNDESRQTIQLDFMEKFGLPGVIGAIDGTHIAILQPLEDEHIYFNRKGYHSKNVQIICNANLEILNVNANFGGSAHDAYIWRNSAVYQHLQELYMRGNQRVWLIGDSGYPLQPWLMTPITNTVEGTPERRFDDAFKSARNCVERCIGTLKSRWRCLLKERMLRYNPQKAGVIINACCVLHNMCIKGDDPIDDLVEDNEDIQAEPININDYFDNNILQEGRRQRQNIVALYFRN